MRRKMITLAAAVMAALLVTACGNGEGIVINGTTGAQGGAEVQSGADASAAEGEETSPAEESSASGGTKIDIITVETEASTAAETEPETTPAPTSAPTTAAPTTAAPTTAAPATTAAREYAVRDVSKTMYANSSVRVRASYSTSSDILGSLAEGESVTITGESDNGWMRVTWKGQTGFVSKSYLSDTPPATTAAASENSRPTATQSGNSTPGAGTTPGTGTTPGAGTTPGTGTTPGGTTPGSNTSPSPGNTQGPGATGAATNPGTGTSGGTTGGANGSVTGTVTDLSPSGVTIQASNGTSYTFSWGSSSIPSDLQQGNTVKISYQGSTVVQISK